ncbi:MAG: hypothetical protein RRY99_18050 [Flavobacterium sp.]
MKSISLKSLFIILCVSINFAFAQSTFKDKNLQFLEEVAVVSQSDINSFMKKKGFSFEDSAEKFDSKMFAFKNSSDQSVIVAYTNTGKLYAINFTIKGDMNDAESELESKQFKMQDDMLKKSGYKYFFTIEEYKGSTSAVLFTNQHNFNKPSKNDRMVTVERLKSVLGENNKSVQKILAQKKYFHDKDLDDEKDGRKEEVFTDVGEDTNIVVSYKNGKSFTVEIDNITTDDYNNVLKWLKSNKNEKMKPEYGLFRIRDSWDILNGDYTVFLLYDEEPNFKPIKIGLRKND